MVCDSGLKGFARRVRGASGKHLCKKPEIFRDFIFSYFLVRGSLYFMSSKIFQKFLGRLPGWLAGQTVGPGGKSRTVLRGAVRRRQ